MKIKMTFLGFVLVLLQTSLGFCQEDTHPYQTALTFYSNWTGTEQQIDHYFILNRKKEVETYIFNFEKDGFVLVESSKDENRIIAFSDKGTYKVKDQSPIPWTMDITVGRSDNSLSSKGGPTNKDMAPLLSDVWGGVNCVDDMGNTVYPSNYFTPNHASPGCVAISMGQILHYYEWPKTGMGNNTYADTYNGELRRHSAFFDATTYDWDNMLDEYMGKASTDEEQRAIGTLMYHTGVALEMDYEPTGSTSNIKNTPFAYHNFFRFSGHYQDVDWPDFWTLLHENIQLGRPVPVAVDASRTGDGHVFMVNGYQEVDGEPFYHLNWGWYNDNNINGWYNIEAWTSDSPGYNTITGAVFDLLPNPEITSIEENGDGNELTINWEVSQALQWDAFVLEHKVDEGAWEQVAADIDQTSYTVINPTGKFYQFRVKAKVNGTYYDDSWSETEVYSFKENHNGYISFGGEQYAYARQTPENSLDFSNDYTFEAWIRLEENNMDGNVILDQEDVFSLDVVNVSTSDYAVRFKSYSGSNELSSSTQGITIPFDAWAHIAVSNSDNVTRLFINGVLADVHQGGDFELNVSNNALNIAEKYHGGYSSWLIGDMDQLRISTTGRYQNGFIPNMYTPPRVDDQTLAYFPFQDVHKVRLKDEAHILSVIVKNEPGQVEWNFETFATPSEDKDGDGVPDDLDQCPDTPEGSTVDINGCDIFHLPSNNFTIRTTGAYCVGSANGSISISALETLDYEASLTGNGMNETDVFSNEISFGDLTSGDYQICMSPIELPSFSQCFDITISEPEPLNVQANTELQQKKLNLALSGGNIYYIQLNGTLYTTSRSSINLPLTKGANALKVSTDKNCQGEYSEVINIGNDILIYPNPVVDGRIHLAMDNLLDKQVEVRILSYSGSQVLYQSAKPINGQVDINVNALAKGTYILYVKAKNKSYSHKFIKY
ncbi:C10 family peptidase [Flagellimonas oceanensis]|uniref:C10 family peptidase n=1 Tax=Flagellimonas oceanensis TaxID=2499163 RepID=UPI003BACE58F